MTIRRVVPDITAPDPQVGKSFYVDVLGLELVMDMGWILTFASRSNRTAQINVMARGAASIATDYSVEVADLDACYARAKAQGCEIVYPLTVEPWGVRRFFVRDPHGKVVNVMCHLQDDTAD